MVDGPGVRYVVFLQGCNMRCKYCHNPETWAKTGGTRWSAENLLKHIIRYKNYWKDNGGITVSGGEPLLQIDFVTELFALAKKEGVHTALDTCGQPFSLDKDFLEKFDKLAENTDLFILDLKEMDSLTHKALTGFGNENILQMAQYLSQKGKPMWIRHVLVPTLTDSRESLQALKAFVDGLNTVEKVEILPYHTLGLSKWTKLGIDYPLDGIPTPTRRQIEKAKEILGI